MTLRFMRLHKGLIENTSAGFGPIETLMNNKSVEPLIELKPPL